MIGTVLKDTYRVVQPHGLRKTFRRALRMRHRIDQSWKRHGRKPLKPPR
jgi:hypothetical protein